MRVSSEESSHFRRNDEVASRPSSKRGTESSLRQAEAVVRCRVEVTNASLPRESDRVVRILIGDAREEVANGGSAKSQFGHRHVGPTHDVRFHSFSPMTSKYTTSTFVYLTTERSSRQSR